MRKLAFAAFRTQCEVHYAGSSEQALNFERAVLDWINGFETQTSLFPPDSLINRINAAAGRTWIEVGTEMEKLLGLCDALHFMTQGLLDPSIGPLIRLWNFDAPNPRVPSADEIAAARELVGWKRVLREPGKIFLPEAGMALDFGAFAREYAVDFVAQLAAEHGITSALIDFGPDRRAVGSCPGQPAWHVGLADARAQGSFSGTLVVNGQAIAVSADRDRGFTCGGKRYGPIIDPRTGWPVSNGCRQATVIAASCLQAGVLSTTGFILGVSKGIEFIQASPGAEGLLVTDRERAQTRGFGNFYLQA